MSREFWDARYAEPSYIFGTEPNAFLAAQKHRLKPGQVALAVADGEGRNGVWLAEQGLVVHSVDLSPVASEKARRLAAQRNVQLHFEVADLADWEWGEARFEVIAAIFIQFAPPELRSRLFARMKQALRPGGLLLMQGYTPRQLEYRTGGPSNVDQLYTAELLREHFGELELLELREHDAVLSEGSRHAGPSALIDLVARKPR